jgi:anti-sigma regulatory factor (Ser/Thr protein kinase)
MFGTPLVTSLMRDVEHGADLIDILLAELARFTGANHEQEDDITLVTLERAALPVNGAWHAEPEALAMYDRSAEDALIGPGGGVARIIGEFAIPSAPGNERMALRQVAEAVATLAIAPAQLERLKTAVAEATMNAIEHGNENRPELDVRVRVLATDTTLAVQIRDHGGNRAIPEHPETPDLDAKLAGLQSPRGWGLFLIKNMVDEMNVASDEQHHTVELIVKLKGAQQ